MNKQNSDFLNTIVANYFQFQKHHKGEHSALFEDIDYVLKCGVKNAEKFASTHCNMVSFWALNYAQEKTDMLYRDFFETMLENNFCNDKGRIKVDKDIICDEIFGFKFKIKYFQDYEDIINPLARLDKKKGYQIKMKADTSGDHFLSSYIDDATDIFMGVDPSYRGTPFILKDKITPKNFLWLLEV